MPKTRGHHADLHEKLIKKGYSYQSAKGKWSRTKKEYPLGRTIVYKDKNGNVATQKLIKKGRKASRVNVRISKRLTKTREHGTPDVYELTIKKAKSKKKSAKKRKTRSDKGKKRK